MNTSKNTLTARFAHDAIHLSDKERILKLQALTVDMAEVLRDIAESYPNDSYAAIRATAALAKAGL